MFVFQISFINYLIYPANYINLVLPVLIFLVVYADRTIGIYWFLFLGFLMELYSPYFYGSVLLALLGCLAILDFLARNFFTNKSLHGLIALAMIGSVIYELFLFIPNYSFQFWAVAPSGVVWDFWQIGVSLLINIAAVVVLFFLWRLVSGYFRAYFKYK